MGLKRRHGFSHDKAVQEHIKRQKTYAALERLEKVPMVREELSEPLAKRHRISADKYIALQLSGGEDRSFTG